MNNKILCIDLDGTLIRTDMLWESLMYQIRHNPSVLFLSCFWLIKGKFYLKEKLARNFRFDPALLPYNKEVVDFIKEKRNNDYKVYLVSASADIIVNTVFQHLYGILFDGYFASGSRYKKASNGDSNEEYDYINNNLSSFNKRDLLNKVFGPGNYDYLGNSYDDIAVWNECNNAYIYATTKEEAKKINKLITNKKKNVIKHEISNSNIYLAKKILSEIRIHHWAKNILIICPAFAVHSLLNLYQYIELMMSFFAFCFLTSVVYVINDLMDLWNDRSHVNKRNRPLASGDLSINLSISIISVCFILFSLLSLCISIEFYASALIYFIINMLYSFSLKNIIAIDCILLACMYTYRVFLGCVATDMTYSLWLFTFSIFLFLFLAFIKRYIELIHLQKQGKKSIVGRPYTTSDIPIISSMYTSFGSLSILVFAMYLNSDDIKATFSNIWYAYGSLLVILYWVVYMFIKTSRDEINEDPVEFVLKDKLSITLGLLFVFLFFLGAML